MAAKNLKKRLRDERGQAAIETGLTLTFVIWLLYYSINAFHALHTAHIGQKYAAMNLYQRLDNQAKFVVDSVENRLHGQTFMGVQYTTRDGQTPTRRILLEGSTAPEIRTRVGICMEPTGTCAP